MPVIPIELVGIIIDFLHDYKPALQACSLVARGWVDTSRFHLFRYLNLNDSDSHKSVQRLARLCDVLKISPALAKHITYFKIIHTGKVGILGNPDLPTLVAQLHFLASLKITTFGFSADDAGRISQELSRSIRSLSFLKEIQFNKLEFFQPLEIIRLLHSSLLTKLTLTNLTFDLPDVGDPLDILQYSVEQRARPIELVIDNAVLASFFIQPHSPIDLSGLRVLEVWPSTTTYSALIQILSQTTILQRLDLTLGADPDYAPPIDLLSLSSLDTLVFRVRALVGRENPLPWLHSVLSSLPPNNLTQELSLVVTVDIPPPELTRAQFEQFLWTWKQFDLLFTEAKFLPLRRVRVDFRIDNVIGDVIVKSMVDEIIDELSELDARGILHIDSYETAFG